MKNKNFLLLAIGSVITAAAAFFFVNKGKHPKTEKPPKGAPQLNVENPGDQSNFITAPSDSKLG
ncbi:MAG: hypothetical protein H0U44_01405 [Flavisolibacter sp.]|jgi:uncharacterized membrane protein YdjX (TVP38/TMEM64 family)|nr:hypothetical protein [Flavisolibacter sp.]